MSLFSSETLSGVYAGIILGLACVIFTLTGFVVGVCSGRRLEAVRVRICVLSCCALKMDDFKRQFSLSPVQVESAWVIFFLARCAMGVCKRLLNRDIFGGDLSRVSPLNHLQVTHGHYAP